jgi:hypothetical protein
MTPDITRPNPDVSERVSWSFLSAKASLFGVLAVRLGESIDAMVMGVAFGVGF